MQLRGADLRSTALSNELHRPDSLRRGGESLHRMSWVLVIRGCVLAFAIGVVVPWQPLVVLLAPAMLILSWFWYRRVSALWLLGLSTVTLVWIPPGATVLTRITPTFALALLTCSVALLSGDVWRSLSHKEEWRLLRPIAVMVLLAASTDLAALVAPDPRVVYSFPNSGTGPLATAAAQAAVLGMVCVLPMAVAGTATSQWVASRLHAVILGTSSVIGLAVLAGLIFHVGYGVVAGTLRPSAGYLSGGGVGLPLLITLPLAYSYVAGARHRVNKILALVALCLIAAGLAVSISRISWIAGTAEVCLMATLFGRKLGAGMAMLLGGTVIATVVLIPDSVAFVLKFFDSNQAYGLERLQIGGDALAIWLSHPVLGVGAGFFQFYDRSLAVAVNGAGATHNQYLSLLSENGPLGLVVLVWFLFTLFRTLLESAKNDLRPQVRALARVLLVATVGLTVSGFAGDTFFVSVSLGGGIESFTLLSGFWLLLGTLFALRRTLPLPASHV